jgi:hypothetical protein
MLTYADARRLWQLEDAQAAAARQGSELQSHRQEELQTLRRAAAAAAKRELHLTDTLTQV